MIKKFLFVLVYSTFVGLPVFATAATLTLKTPTVSCANGTPQVALAWNSMANNASYSIFRSASSTWSNLSSKQSAINYTDKSVSASTTYQYQIKATVKKATYYSNIVSVTAPNCSTSTGSTSTSTKDIVFTAYTTGYGWPDNTPPGGAIAYPIIHQTAGGTGTYTDPITLATGYSIINGKNILDYATSTRFYLPALHRYFIVEDLCGDGATPQNGPCHTGYLGNPWLDLWVGGNGTATSSIYACENTITNLHTVIQNPSANYIATSSPIFFNGKCTPLFSETPQTI